LEAVVQFNVGPRSPRRLQRESFAAYEFVGKAKAFQNPSPNPTRLTGGRRFMPEALQQDSELAFNKVINPGRETAWDFGYTESQRRLAMTHKYSDE